jgi:hypothetical protein
MQDAVTEHVRAAPETVWALVADVTQTHRYSEETFEAEWLDGASGPAVGARFRGHVERNGRGPTYWSTCRVTACEPGREFGFEVLVGGRPINHWHYRFAPYWAVLGRARGRTNRRNMRATLQSIKAVVEADD